MCLSVFLWNALPGYKLVLIFNRDEFFDRPTDAADFWKDQSHIFGGRDRERGGTWLGTNVRNGRIAWLTNVREPMSMWPPNAQSRGQLLLSALETELSPLEYLRSVDGSAYAGFNLVVADLRAGSLCYGSNRAAGHVPRELGAGAHALSNASMDVPWPKTVRALRGVGAALGVDDAGLAGGAAMDGVGMAGHAKKEDGVAMAGGRNGRSGGGAPAGRAERVEIPPLNAALAAEVTPAGVGGSVDSDTSLDTGASMETDGSAPYGIEVEGAGPRRPLPARRDGSVAGGSRAHAPCDGGCSRAPIPGAPRRAPIPSARLSDGPPCRPSAELPFEALFAAMSDPSPLESPTGNGFMPPEFVSALSAVFVPPCRSGPEAPLYGTRCQTVLAVADDGTVTVRERARSDETGRWAETSRTFSIDLGGRGPTAGGGGAGVEVASREETPPTIVAPPAPVPSRGTPTAAAVGR